MSEPHRSADAEGCWLPVSGVFEPKMVAALEAMQAGLTRIGLPARVETLGSNELPVRLLRVCTPHASVETAEQWLLQRLRPHLEETWADEVSCWVTRRWRDFSLLSGSVEEIEPIAARIRNAPVTSAWPFEPVRFLQYSWPNRQDPDAPPVQTLACYARTATEVVRHLPGVRSFGPEPSGDPRRWLAIGSAGRPAEVRELLALGRGLDALGFTTCRYEWQNGASALLTIDAGDATCEELEEQITARLPTVRPGWARSFHPSFWIEGIWIHRQEASDGWLLRAWLQRQLGEPVVNAMHPPGRDVAIGVPPSLVDRALELLARRPATIGPDDVEGVYVPPPLR